VSIGVLLVVIAVFLGIEMKSLLVGEGAEPDQVRAIEAALVDSDSISRVIHLKTLHLGPEELLVGAKVAVEGGDTAEAVARAIDEAEHRVRSAVPIARVIYLEPDIYHGAPRAAAHEEHG
jgi:divalent metal cation (Fe/Co/Zn/Cd) transporter